MIFADFEAWVEKQPGFTRVAIPPMRGPRGEVICEYYRIEDSSGKTLVAAVPSCKPLDEIPNAQIEGICRQLNISPPDFKISKDSQEDFVLNPSASLN